MRTFLALILLAAACRKAPAPASPAPSLGRALDNLRVVAPCDKVVGVEWARGWPVPAGGGTGRFAVFFYPLTGDPDSGPKLGAVAARAVFDAKAGTVAECAALPKGKDPAPGERWPEASSRLDMKGFTSREAELYERAERAAAAFSGGGPGGSEAREFWESFDALAEPAFRDDYYRLSPGFWEWLRAAGLKSLDKPKA